MSINTIGTTGISILFCLVLTTNIRTNDLRHLSRTSFFLKISLYSYIPLLHIAVMNVGVQVQPRGWEGRGWTASEVPNTY